MREVKGKGTWIERGRERVRESGKFEV